MKIGILDADWLAKALKDEYVNYHTMFKKMFLNIESGLEVIRYNALESEFPTDLCECDAYLITGSKADAYGSDPWIHELRNFVRRCHKDKKKLIGICFGHQLVAEALGGKTAKSDKGWGVGIKSAEWKQSLNFSDSQAPAIIKGESFNLLVTHQDQVLRLPTGASLLASNSFCTNSAYIIDNHILCFQGHPEFTKHYSKTLMELRETALGEKVFREGIASLHEDEHGNTIARIILAFIKHNPTTH